LAQITAISQSELITVQHRFVHVVVPVLTQEHAQPGEDGRSGASLEVRNWNNEVQLFRRAGTAPEDKFLAYDQNARDKNGAFVTHPEIQLSWEVHRGIIEKNGVKLKPYPGGIRTPYDDRFAISGFTWPRDTIGSLYLANTIGRISVTEARKRADICNLRQDFERLMCKFAAKKRQLADA